MVVSPFFADMRVGLTLTCDALCIILVPTNVALQQSLAEHHERSLKRIFEADLFPFLVRPTTIADVTQ